MLLPIRISRQKAGINTARNATRIHKTPQHHCRTRFVDKHGHLAAPTFFQLCDLWFIIVMCDQRVSILLIVIAGTNGLTSNIGGVCCAVSGVRCAMHTYRCQYTHILVHLVYLGYCHLGHRLYWDHLFQNWRSRACITEAKHAAALEKCPLNGHCRFAQELVNPILQPTEGNTLFTCTTNTAASPLCMVPPLTIPRTCRC